MAGLVPAIHVFHRWKLSEDVDARHKAGHDDERNARKKISRGKQ
jgi:hypothetical protein